MKKIILLFFLGITISGFSQTTTITDKSTGEPIILATFTSEIPKANTITNNNGQLDLSIFKSAKKIEIRALGYKTEIKSYDQIAIDSFIVELSTSNINIDEIVVSATRWCQKTSDIPSKVISISASKMEIQNPQTAADLLNISGKVFIQKSQQGGGSPMIRGFSTNRLLYTIDGVRMNTAIFRAGNIQNVISLDPFSIENTEVFFGPGSIIYGSDAIGGVMSFKTLSPQLSLTDNQSVTGTALTRYSSANSEKTAHFDIGLGWKKWALTTSISSFNYGNLLMGSFGPEEYLRKIYVQRIDNTDVVLTNENPRLQVPSGYTQINMIQKIRFKPNEKWDFQYGLHYSETSDYSRYDRHIRYKNGLPRYGEWYYGPQKWMMNNFSVNQNANNSIYDQMTLQIAQQSFEESRISRDINQPNREIRIEQVEAYSLNLDFIKSIAEKNKLFYGIESVINYVKSTGIDEDIDLETSQKAASRYPQSTWASYAAYVSDQFAISNKFLMQAGIRYNKIKLDADFDTTFYPFPYTKANLNNDAITGSFGFVFRPTDTWVISANAATAFRSPNVDDLGKVFDSEPGSVVVPNPDLKSEYAYNLDFGIAKVFGDFLKIDLTFYYTQLKNAMVRRDFTLNGLDSIIYDGEMSKVQAIQNAAVANVYGIQAGLEIKLPAGFRFSSDINYQKGEEELDDGTTSPSRHAAPFFGTARFIYSANKLNLQFYAIYNAEKKFEDLPEEEKGKDYIYAIDKNGNPYSPAWYTLNFKAMYKFTNNFSISSGIENITDQRYRPYSSGIVAPGRNFIISIKASF
ncbi:MAG: TonB-dependent receptor [Bacteroidales bacterium]|nr:TonB-dependent receptor [Bacteroidales bacterium]MBN2758352.1 TonB-dependent receptor [Bacteroidales bacterium]